MSLIVVGSVAYDGVETPHGKVDRMLGGAATYISLAASYFTPVKIVAVVGNDFAQEDVDLLESRHIGLEGLERVADGKTFFWAGVYSADMNDRTTLRTDLNVFAGFDPKLPASYRAAPYLFLGNIQPGLQRSVRAFAEVIGPSPITARSAWLCRGPAEQLLPRPASRGLARGPDPAARPDSYASSRAAPQTESQ